MAVEDLRCFSDLINLAFRAHTDDFKHIIMSQYCLSVSDSDRFPAGYSLSQMS